MLTEAREQMAQAQGQLVQALIAGGAAPPDFDADDLRSAGRSLLVKRYRQVQLAWPGLDAALGNQSLELFAEFARQSPLPVEIQGRVDGYAFARWLQSRHLLNDTCRVMLIAAELHGIQRPRRGLAFRFAWLKRCRRLVMGLKLPGCKPWIFPSDFTVRQTQPQNCKLIS